MIFSFYVGSYMLIQFSSIVHIILSTFMHLKLQMLKFFFRVIFLPLSFKAILFLFYVFYRLLTGTSP